MSKSVGEYVQTPVISGGITAVASNLIAKNSIPKSIGNGAIVGLLSAGIHKVFKTKYYKKFGLKKLI